MKRLWLCDKGPLKILGPSYTLTTRCDVNTRYFFLLIHTDHRLVSHCGVDGFPIERVRGHVALDWDARWKLRLEVHHVHNPAISIQHHIHCHHNHHQPASKSHQPGRSLWRFPAAGTQAGSRRRSDGYCCEDY